MNPRLFFRDLSGASMDSRLLPPGMDRPTPNLASVPPIPERPDPAAREALTRRLQAERDANSAETPRGPDARLADTPSPGQPPIPARPPAPPALAAAAPVPWVQPGAGTPLRPSTPARTDGPPVIRPPELLTPDRLTPGDVPSLPTPDLLGPAPGAGTPPAAPIAPGDVPAPPPAELLAPR
ncbi:hypothetical protein [Roseococcus sp. YIM B11640]|uniref:hypothetical protein n=1 Tax=Roseococcus sp. YIM B11640 TaxID=3133973 RepID=UPI003C7EACD8